jgi:hypothetical protein
VVSCVVAMLVWILYTVRNSPSSLSIFLAIAFATEGLLERYHARRILVREHWKAS